ncbi:2-dehydro-3-deoxygalactonokinase [Sulfitobacter guttiformis KCTC 32187]|uniref:2-dehydro-3-deoxygalactonokinase n=2 Tax=Sulfitobacter guttiformis TaxID=74349 RepID=J7G4L8_9RHOB|nr:2-dehydro-3-deoxygalactonokinase [Sulfitobacter guttiformis]AFP55391.1 2-dehydro-3-deoxygalactonokinase [Sulfitobacter guttiformis]KIN75546.1 2-dehydro-3-deoxygalactonokinase [Sulfitobacter guttiformis KCTC 32187]RKE91056.1 2-dehydro-3-deoxygalactonokinase [Sulfitobacter guttiformis]
MQETAEWIAVDLSNGCLRVWIMGANGEPIAQAVTDKSAVIETHSGFETALLALVAPYLAQDHRVTCVICSGVAGWNVPYVATPCTPPQRVIAASPAFADPRIKLYIPPALKQMSPPDLMGGEATTIAGLLRSQPEFDGVLCMPGLHTKWVHISAGEIVSFQTSMTGALFDLLSQQSVLQQSVAGTAWDAQSFLTGVGDAMGRPQAIASQLFGIHAATSLLDMSGGAARARLSGLLIGLELAGTRPYWLGRHVAIIGVGDTALHYRTALAEQGVQGQLLEAPPLVLAGLCASYESTQNSAK